jgi:hypothetical protein
VSNKTRQLGCHSVAQLATCPLRDLILSSPSLAAAATALALLLPWPLSLSYPTKQHPLPERISHHLAQKNKETAQQHETHEGRSMSHQSQPGQAVDTNRKMYGRETEKAGSLPRLGRERERRRRRSNRIRRPSGAAAPPSHPTPGRTLGQECGTATRPPPNPRLALPSPFALHRGQHAGEAAGSECGAQESEAAGGAIGPNPRDTTDRRQRQNRGGPSSTRPTTRAENQAQCASSSV